MTDDTDTSVPRDSLKAWLTKNKGSYVPQPSIALPFTWRQYGASAYVSDIHDNEYERLSNAAIDMDCIILCTDREATPATLTVIHKSLITVRIGNYYI